MWLRKEQGGSQIGPHMWEGDGDVTEVPDALGASLLAIRGAGFTAVEPPHGPCGDSGEKEDGAAAEDPEDAQQSAEASAVTEPAPEPDAAVDEAPKPASRRGRPASKAKGPVTE
jgi:hypothetical protein